MKTLKSVVAIFAALLLFISLSGCFEEGAKAVSGSVFSGTIREYELPVGTESLRVTYCCGSSEDKSTYKQKFQEELSQKVKIWRIYDDERMSPDVSYKMSSLRKPITISVDTSHVSDVMVELDMGVVAVLFQAGSEGTG
jgi:hypothetical protein